MNKSYSKIRHIQESNQILEKRILSEKKVKTGLYEQGVIVPNKNNEKQISKLEDLVGKTILLKPKEILGLSKDQEPDLKNEKPVDVDTWDFTKDSEQIDSKSKDQIMGYNINDKIKTIKSLSNDVILIFLEKHKSRIWFRCGEEVFRTEIPPKSDIFGPIRDYTIEMLYTCPGASKIINQLLPCGGHDLSSSGVDLSSINSLS